MGGVRGGEKRRMGGGGKGPGRVSATAPWEFTLRDGDERRPRDQGRKYECTSEQEIVQWDIPCVTKISPPLHAHEDHNAGEGVFGLDWRRGKGGNERGCSFKG